MKPLAHQIAPIKAALDYLKDPKDTKPGIIVGPTACHAKGYRILKHDGQLIKVEDIRVGDILMGNDSTPRKVLKTHCGTDKMYKVVVRNGIEFKVNSQHILKLYRTSKTSSNPKREREYAPEVEVSVEDYLSWAKSRKHVYKLKRSGCNFEKSDSILELDPYFLGIWLGDGHKNTCAITSPDTEVIDYVYDYAEKLGLKVTIAPKQKTATCSYLITGDRGKNNNVLLYTMQELNLINNKHIPHKYLTASIETRLQLLAGLIDSDGHRTANTDNYEIIVKMPQLADSIYHLLGSLGYSPTKKVVMKACMNCEDNSKKPYYRINFRGSVEIPVKIPRKKSIDCQYRSSRYNYTFDIVACEEEEYFGFTVDQNHLYLDEHFFIQHNCGKSYIISSIANQFDGPVLVLQPSQELLEQNIEKLFILGGEATIYSASLNSKTVSKLTYATLGSVKVAVDELKAMGVKTVLIDECHATFAPDENSQFSIFMRKLAPTKVIGLTATPFRLKSSMEGSELKLLTRMRPNYFKQFLSIIQIQEIVETGYWSRIDYERHQFDETGLEINTSGSDYSEDSIREAIKVQGINNNIYLRTKQLLRDGVPSILVFVDSVENAETMAKSIKGAACVHGKTNKKERSKRIQDFKSGKIKVMVNVGVLTTGFDYPDLRCIIMGRPTMSLALYYQIIGRGTRISPATGKESCLYIDYCNNVDRFGRIENLRLEEVAGWGYGIFSNNLLLTNTPIAGLRKTKEDILRKIHGKIGKVDKIWFGAHNGKAIEDLPIPYIKFILFETGWDFGSPKMKSLQLQLKAVLAKQEQRSLF